MADAEYTLPAGERALLINAHDSLSVLKRMATGSVDAVITDPPYSSGGAFRGDRMSDTGSKYVQTGTELERPNFSGDNRDQRAYLMWCSLWLSEALRVARPGSPILVFTDWRQLPTTTDALQCGGWVWRGIVPWDKGEGTRPVMGRFRNQAEYVVWGSAGPMPVERAVGVLPGSYTVPVLQADKHHQTGKPTALMRRLVRIVEPGGIILDPFSGSFTTGVAALAEGYRFIGIEREPAYVEVGRQRLAEVQDLSSSASEQASLFGVDRPLAEVEG